MDNNGCLVSFTFVLGGLIGIFIIYGAFIAGIPSAMDVYQGKTELEYTYRNGIAVDSIVVFKN